MMNQDNSSNDSSSSPREIPPMNPFEQRVRQNMERPDVHKEVTIPKKREVIETKEIKRPIREEVNPFSNKDNPFKPKVTEIEDNDEKELEFDVDELVKKIDAKIAELEREEALERQKAKTRGPSSDKTTVVPKSSEQKPVIEEETKKPVDINLNELEEDDDDFFDDFFDN